MPHVSTQLCRKTVWDRWPGSRTQAVAPAVLCEGLAGLLPRARGPKSAHKLTDEVMRLIEQHRRAGAPLQARSLAALVQSTLGISVHPRSIERAMARKKKR
jgi:hypothetical protein